MGGAGLLEETGAHQPSDRSDQEKGGGSDRERVCQQSRPRLCFGYLECIGAASFRFHAMQCGCAGDGLRAEGIREY